MVSKFVIIIVCVYFNITTINLFIAEEDETRAQREQKQLERARKHALSSSMIQELKEEYLDTPLEVTHGSVRHMQTSKFQKARQE